jgi:hypothetical protein
MRLISWTLRSGSEQLQVTLQPGRVRPIMFQRSWFTCLAMLARLLAPMSIKSMRSVLFSSKTSPVTDDIRAKV